GERFADTWPFTGRKTELLEGGLRIPAIVSWPARLPKGHTTDQVAISMDWLPTLAAAARGTIDRSSPSDGIDLLPHLIDPATMLPEIDESSTDNLTGDTTPDRPGAVATSRKADNPPKKPATKPGGRPGLF